MTEDGMERAVLAVKSGRNWVKFVGVIAIIYGATYCLSIVGVVIGWLPLWLGIILLQAGEQASKLEKTREETTLAEYVRLINKMFRIAGIAELVLLILTGVMMVVLMIAGLFAYSHKKEIREGAQKVWETRNKGMPAPIKTGKFHLSKIQINPEGYRLVLKNGKTATLHFSLLATLENRDENASKEENDNVWKIYDETMKALEPLLNREVEKLIQKTPAEEFQNSAGQQRIRNCVKEAIRRELPKIERGMSGNPDAEKNESRFRDVMIVNWNFQ